MHDLPGGEAAKPQNARFRRLTFLPILIDLSNKTPEIPDIAEFSAFCLCSAGPPEIADSFTQ